MNEEVLEALRSAHELCEFLWNNTDSDNTTDANVELVAHTDVHAEQLAALLNDARTRIDSALHGIELQQADIGTFEKGPNGPVSERLMSKFYGPPR
jgi:hypothetical protein